MLIPFITEPDYGNSSIWCAETRTGIEAEIARKKYTSINIDSGNYRFFDYETLFAKNDSRRMVVLIGTSQSWIPEALDYLTGHDIDVLLVSYQPPENAPVRGVVRIDYVAGIDTLLRHLVECGCRRPALYGCFINSSADSIKYRAFNESTSRTEFFDHSGIFENSAGLARCYEDFRPHAHEFDSLLCVNDIAAASLINRLRADRIGVPEDLQVVCFGSSEISRLYRPSITSLSLRNAELGRQSVSAFAYLAKSERDVSLSVRVGGSLTVRESTRRGNVLLSEKFPRVSKHPYNSNFYEDEEVKAFMTLENILIACDELDISILVNMLGEETTERIAEELSLAPETVRYRVRRILQNAGMKSRIELLEYIRGNNFGSVICK